jgi:hypothetical protein
MSNLLKPPRVPTVILSFFANQPDFSVVAGDMIEEYQQRARNSGARAADVWFWRDTVRNAWAFTLRELLGTPAQTAAIALACVTAVHLVPGLSGLLVFRLNLRLDPELTWAASVLLQLVAPAIAGWAGAKLSIGREWALALAFACFSASWAAAGWYISDLYVSSVLKGSHQLESAATLLVGRCLLCVPQVTVFWLGSLWTRQSGTRPNRIVI